MKTDLSYLPANKQQELYKAVDIICGYVNVEMIILFGSYARGDWVEERATDGYHWHYQSDYDILVLVDNKKLARRESVWRYLRQEIRHILDIPASIISHSVRYFNQKLSNTEYFYMDILKEGVLLYDSKNFELCRPKPLNLIQRKQKAIEDFDYWFKKSVGFMKSYRLHFDEKEYVLSAFMLHQASEHCFAAALLVFTNYKPKTHDLEELIGFIAAQAHEFLSVFPLGTVGQKQLFELLRSAYVDARYKKEYSITQDELIWLCDRVTVLHQLTQRLCQAKIEAFDKQLTVTY